MKLLKKMKLINAVIALVIIAVASIGANELLANLNMRKINNNMSALYMNNLIPIARIGGMRGAFLTIRINVNKAILGYSASYDDEIKNEISSINNYMKDYEAAKLEGFEVNGVNEFKACLQQYVDMWNKAKISLAKNEPISKEDIKALEDISHKIDEILVSLRDFNEKKAAEVNSESDAFYKRSLIFLASIFMIITLLYILISTFIIRVIRTSSKEVIQALNIVSEGNLTIDVEDDGNNEFALMKNALSTTIKKIRIMIEQIKQTSLQLKSKAESLSAVSEEMSSSSNNVAAAIEDVADGTSSQSEDIVHTNAFLNEFSQRLEEVIVSIEQITAGAKDVGNMAEDSNQTMSILIQSIESVHEVFNNFAAKLKSLGVSINRINEISNLINEIADQTNLLALNASIEAARAGEAGKGFAVVADEIRKLAEQSKTSSENINAVISEVSSETAAMLSTSDEVTKEMLSQMNITTVTIEAFEKIIRGIKAVNPQIAKVGKAMFSIQEEKNTIVEKLENTSSISEEISASSQEISASAEEMNASSEEVAGTALELSNMMEDMLDEVNKFKL